MGDAEDCRRRRRELKKYCDANDGGSVASQGRFITIEGGEGAGKSSQTRLLAANLERAGRTVVLTREPGGSSGAEEIRRLLVEGEPGRWSAMTEALLHSAARADHLERLVRPALAAGKWVICDRFVDSTTAYQGYGHGLQLEQVVALNRLVAGSTMPDLTIILDLPVEVGLARAGGREQASPSGEDRYERMAHAFHERLREGFTEIALAEPERCVLIDATAEEEEVAAVIAGVVEERLGPEGPDLGRQAL